MTRQRIKPIFIFSLPRSGSTLLQRILSNHPRIHSVSEPWILLPLFETLSSTGTFTEYSRRTTSIALNELFKNFPKQKEDLYIEIRNFTLNLYEKICSNQKNSADYFLDKTPRYHCVLDHIHYAFPHAKFIYLMRNPLSMVASMLQTEPKQIWNLYFFNIDLYKGIINLLESIKKHAETSIIVNYEHLIENPDKVIKQLFDYLEIDNSSNDISLQKNMYIAGSMGDRLNNSKENQFTLNSLNKWKRVINNPVRKYWCINYIRWIGGDRLNAMGYDKETILDSLYRNYVAFDRQMFKDIYRILFGVFYSVFEYTIVKENIKNIKNIFKVCAKT